MCKILNLKSPEAGNQLNDRDKSEPKTDLGLGLLLQMASVIKLINPGERCVRIRGLTGDTENVFYLTLLAMVYIIIKLLDVGFDYVLPGKIQSNHLEGEFSIYHCSTVSNY